MSNATAEFITAKYNIPPEPNFVDTDTMVLEYQMSGNENEQTLLFVHGLGANQSQFEYQHTFFKETYRVISVSLRGHGKSSCPKKLKTIDFKLKKMAQDLVKLLDILYIEKVHYVGNSLGGNIGYEFLKSYPERLYSITTFGTTAYLKKSPVFVSFIKLMYRIIGIKTLSNLSYATGVTDYSKNKIRDMISNSQKETLMSLLPNLEYINYLKVIKKSTTRALIIKGDKDYEINTVLQKTIDCFLERGNFELKELKNAGHFANLDTPERFNIVLLSFLKTV